MYICSYKVQTNWNHTLCYVATDLLSCARTALGCSKRIYFFKEQIQHSTDKFGLHKLHLSDVQFHSEIIVTCGTFSEIQLYQNYCTFHGSHSCNLKVIQTISVFRQPMVVKRNSSDCVKTNVGMHRFKTAQSCKNFWSLSCLSWKWCVIIETWGCTTEKGAIFSLCWLGQGDFSGPHAGTSS